MNISGSLFFLSLLFPLITSSDICPISSCNTSNFKIKFPFYKAGYSIDCSYSRFDLSCTKKGLTSIDLPTSGEFLVRNINYSTQEIKIYDSRSCIAKRLLSFDLSYSVYTSPYYVKLTFLTCPAYILKSNYRVIDCLSDSKNSTLATTSLNFATSLRYVCEIIGTFNIPISRPGPYDDYTINYVVKNDILLTWDTPNCMACEARGLECKFDNQYIKVACFDPEKGVTVIGGGPNGHDTSVQTGKGKQTAKIIALCITVPVIFFVIFLFISRCITQHPRNLSTEEITTIQPPYITPPTRGLDDSTIATYQQLTLGESKRLPGSGDDTCVICLSEFCAKDTIRVIPECNHCFHTTCIDEWLRMRGSCPVCRNSPLPGHVET